jgi:hypothetical protein
MKLTQCLTISVEKERKKEKKEVQYSTMYKIEHLSVHVHSAVKTVKIRNYFGVRIRK